MLSLAALLAVIAMPMPSPVAPGLPSARATALAAMRADAEQPANMSPRPRRDRGISVPIPPPAMELEPPTIYGPRDIALPLVVLDPGHGGHDPGARNASSGVLEKDLTLALALAVRDELVRNGRIRIALTRERDRFLALEERYSLARALGATLFISIHADASPEANARGATIYTLSKTASDQEAARLATRENRANMLGDVDLSATGSTVSSILIDLTQRETLAASSRFAELLHREAGKLMPFRTPWRRSAALVVLHAADTPSVLFETGFISNDDEAAWLTGTEGRREVARGVARAVAIYAATRDSATTTP